MSKTVEITYSPAAWDAPPGGIAQQWASPYGGLNVQTPENLISPAFSPNFTNVMLRNGELRSRPQFIRLMPGPDGTNAILGLGSFFSRGGVWHTVCWTTSGMFQLLYNPLGVIAQGRNPWVKVGGPQLSSGSFVRWQVFQGILYYSNNSGHISAWDGAAATPISDIAFLGTGVSGLPPATTTLIGSLFIGELADVLVLLNTTETPVTASVAGPTISFPQRLRWSNVGFNPFGAGTFGSNLGQIGATFDPTIIPNAGTTDFLDVPDTITGAFFIGRVAYILRQNGITEMSPTGVGTAPFDFNHMWASQQGIGNVYSATAAQYGSIGIFVATDNIYMINGANVQPIGGGARDAIMADLGNTNQAPTATIVSQYTLGYTYFTYKLMVSLPSGATRVWTYSIEENNWSPWLISNAIMGIPNKCWLGTQSVQTTTQASTAVHTVGGGGGGNGGGGGGGNGGGGGRGERK